MARLNDLPVAVESLESLKRRFIRQNRELARINSIQSSRIRLLESEMSRLLTENLTLREKIIRLSCEVENDLSNKHLRKEIDALKERFDHKLTEFSNLVSDLGSISFRRVKRRTTDNKMSFELYHQAKMDRENAPRCGGTLSPIMEDKQYPRFTIGFNDALDFPTAVENIGQEWQGIQPEMPLEPQVNIEDQEICEEKKDSLLSEQASAEEVRKKRRDSSFLESITAGSDSPTKSELPQPPVSGSKRKLSHRDNHDLIPQKFDDNDDFQVTRLSELHAKPTGQGHHEVPLEERKPRRALEPKSSNIGFKSQASTASCIEKHATDDVIKLQKPPEPKTSRGKLMREKPHWPEPETASTQLDVESSTMQEKETLPPKTPTATDILSPTSTQPSARTESCDTPPPQSSAAPNILNSCSRPSRRSRSAVSYAEPSLRRKMRRPTKELVGAVEGESRLRRNSKQSLDDLNPSSGGINEAVVNISTIDGPGRERDHNTSPLTGKAEHGVNPLPSKVITTRKRTLHTKNSDLDRSSEPEPSPSSIAISTLIAGRKPQTQEREAEIGVETDEFFRDIQSSGAINPIPVSDTKRRSRRHTSNRATEESKWPRQNQDSDLDFQVISGNLLDDDCDVPVSGGEIRRIQRLAASRRRSMMI